MITLKILSVRARMLTAALVLAGGACGYQSTLPAPPVSPAPSSQLSPQQAFLAAIQSLCGKAFAGTLAESNASDSMFARSAVVMHVRECSPTVIRIPLHVGENRSRTWVITPTATGLRLKHDHRHEDGSEDAVTQYGGDTRGPGTATRQEFHADSLTATLIPAAVTNVWTIEIHADSLFVYALRREGTDRRFRVNFDLKRTVDAPPAPWGSVQN